MIAKYNYYLKDNNALKETSIFLYIRWNNTLLKYYIGETINPKHWNKENREADSKNFPEAPELNTRLEKCLSKAKNVFRRYLNDNNQTPPEKAILKELLDIEFEKTVKIKHTLFSYYQQFINDSKNTKTEKTVQWYENSLEKLKDYSKKKKVDVDFNTIDMTFYNSYIDYLTNECSYRTNTIGKHIQNLIAVLNAAVESNLTTNLQFKQRKFKKLTEVSMQIHLTEDEVQLMYDLDLSENKRLERVRDLFIVSCCTGLRFSDFSKIRRENIKNGFFYLNISKTQQHIVIPIHPFVTEIMNKYSDNENNLPKAISDTKMREYLKELGEMIPELHDYYLKTYKLKGEVVTEKIKKYKLIGTHTGRRSFCTNEYNDKNGVDTYTLMAISGHKTEKSFLIYIKTSPKEHAIKLKEHWETKYKLRAI